MADNLPMPASAPPIVDDPAAPTVFVDELVGVATANGNFHLTFATFRNDHSKNPPTDSLRTSLRIVIPYNSLVRAGQSLSDYMQRVAAAVNPPPPGTPVQ